MLLDLLPSRQEKRATFKDADGWFVDWLTGGTRTTSGEAVGPNNALTLSGYFAAIRNISEDIAKLPLDVVRRPPNTNKREKLRKHPAYRLLNSEPNPQMDAVAFRETLMHHALGWGNGVAEIVRTRTGVLAELQPIDPALLQIDYERDNNRRRRLVYTIRGLRGDPDVKLGTDQVFHIHGLGYTGVAGYSIARYARESIGLAMGQIKSGASLFGNSSTPSGVLSIPNRLSKEAKFTLREGWEENYRGADKRHKTAILDNGASFSPISIPNSDAQWIESMQFMVEDLCRFMRIPPSKVGHILKYAYNSLEMQNIEYLTDCLLGWMIRFEQQVNRKLIRDTTGTIYSKHNANSLLRGDIATRYNAYATGRQWGWESANSVLELEDRDGIGEQGDIYLVPGNMMDANTVNDPAPAGDAVPQPDATDEEPMEAARKLAAAHRVNDQLAGNLTAVGIVHSITSSHIPAFAAVFRRIHDNKRGKTSRERRLELSTGWIRAVALPCVDMAWSLLRDEPRPTEATGSVDDWSQRCASRVLVELAKDSPNIDGLLSSELNNLAEYIGELIWQRTKKGKDD